jgi:DNA-binding MarR family transcriptional regulator
MSREASRPTHDVGASASDAYKSLAAFRAVLRQFLAFSDGATKAAGVTSHQYQAMLIVGASESGAVTVGELAGEMLIRPNGAVQMVNRLEALGMMTRSSSSEDRRQVLIRLTPEGARVLQTLATLHTRELIAHRKLLTDSLQRLKRLEAK